MKHGMTSRQDRTALALILIAICVASSLPQVLAKAFGRISPQDGPSAESRVVLEITLRCDGMCGIERVMRLRLFEDATAEYLTSKSSALDLGKDDILLKKSTQLTKGEYDQFIKLAESPPFLTSAIDYDSKMNFVDSLVLASVIYKNKGTFKQIYLKNYVPSVRRSTFDPPDEVRQLLERAYELCDKIRKSGA